MWRRNCYLLMICLLIGLVLLRLPSVAGIVLRNLIANATVQGGQDQQGGVRKVIDWGLQAWDGMLLEQGGRRLLAQTYLSAQDARAAANILNGDRTSCSDVMTCYLYGQIYYALGHVETAIAIWRSVPKADLYFAFRGNIAYDQGNLAEAFQFYDISWLIADTPSEDKVTMFINLCNARRNARDLRMAIYWCQQAVASRDNYWTELELGHIYYEARLYDLAERILRRAIHLAPDQGGAYYWLGLTLSRLGRLQEGLEALYSSVRLDPKNPWARTDLAGVLALVGEYHKAACEYIKAQELVNQSNQTELLQKIHERIAALPLNADDLRRCSD